MKGEKGKLLPLFWLWLLPLLLLLFAMVAASAAAVAIVVVAVRVAGLRATLVARATASRPAARSRFAGRCWRTPVRRCPPAFGRPTPQRVAPAPVGPPKKQAPRG